MVTVRYGLPGRVTPEDEAAYQNGDMIGGGCMVSSFSPACYARCLTCQYMYNPESRCWSKNADTLTSFSQAFSWPIADWRATKTSRIHYTQIISAHQPAYEELYFADAMTTSTAEAFIENFKGYLAAHHIGNYTSKTDPFWGQTPNRTFEWQITDANCTAEIIYHSPEYQMTIKIDFREGDRINRMMNRRLWFQVDYVACDMCPFDSQVRENLAHLCNYFR